jgi:hypothetical protein
MGTKTPKKGMVPVPTRADKEVQTLPADKAKAVAKGKVPVGQPVK